MPTFVVVNSDWQALKVIAKTTVWVNDARTANTYTSRYQAKRHLKELDNIPDDVKVIELVTEEG